MLEYLNHRNSDWWIERAKELLGVIGLVILIIGAWVEL